MPNRETPIEAVDLDGFDSYDSVMSVARDFAGLIAVFDRQLELTSETDGETRSHLTAAKAAAERGAQLSRELLKRLQPKS